MKKKLAAAMSAVMVAGSAMPILAEENTFAPSTVTGEFTVTSEGETLVISLTAEAYAEDSASISAAMTIPASVSGTEEDMTISLNDVIRLISGDLYVNAAELCNAYEELTGLSVSTYLSMFGVTEDWVEVPALEMMVSETETDETELFDSDLFTNSMAAIAGNFNVETTDDATVISFNGDNLVAAVKEVENLYDSITAQVSDSMSSADLSGVTGVFGDYILAAAEGINMVDPEVSVEDAQSQLNELINAMLDEVLQSVEFSPIQTDSGEKVSDELQAALDAGTTIDCTMTIGEQVSFNAAIAQDEDEVVIDASFDGSVFASTVTENGTELAAVNGTVTTTDNGAEFELTASENGTQELLANGAIAATDNGAEFNLSVSDGEQTTDLSGVFEALENGFNFSVKTTENGQETEFGFKLTTEDGAVITDTEAPQATLLRDVVKSVSAIMYSASQAEEESTGAAE